MKKLSLLILSVFIAISAVDTAKAQQETKIGYVNPQAVLAKMPEMRAIQQRLQNFSDKKREELTQKQQEYQTALQEFEQKIGVISEEASQREQDKLIKLQEDFQIAQQDIQRQIQQRQQELLGPMFNQISTAINAVAEQMGLTYVLNTTTSNGDQIILYASQEFQERYDITDAVMQELGVFE